MRSGHWRAPSVGLAMTMAWLTMPASRHSCLMVASVPRTFINCTEPPLGTIESSRLRVVDPKFWDGAWLPGSEVVEMKTGHDPMVSDPQGLLALLLASLGSFLYLAAATVLIRALLYGLCCAALPVLRRQQQSPQQLPLATILPWLACIVCLWLASQVSSTSVWLTAALIALGLVLSLLAKGASKR